MRLDEIVCWYQKKIGTYDKQQWEKTVEQRILNGFVNVPLKNAKLKTDLIDVDLVRGSSFPKAKPKQSLIKVLQLALLRLLLLPFYAKWWIAHTSPKVFSVLFIVYFVQLTNWCIYYINVYIAEDSDSGNAHISELLVPCVLSLILSIIHSQIVATASHNGKTQKSKPHFTINKTKKRERIKRKRKNIRIRPIPSEIKPSNLPIDKGKSFGSAMKLTPTLNYPIPNASTNSAIIPEILDSFIVTKQVDNLFSSNCVRKRNVNWDSPIKSQLEFNEISRILPPPTLKDDVTKMVIDFYNELIDKTEQNNCDPQPSPPVLLDNPNNGGDDDGFESLNGKSSSGEENLLINNINVVHDNDQMASKLSDSDTDTLKCTNSTIRSRRNSLSLPLTSIHVKKSKTLSSSESDCSDKKTIKPVKSSLGLRKNKGLSDSDTDQEDDDDGETASTPGIGTTHFKEVTTSATEWIGITTNSEECSYSSEIHTDSHNEDSENCAEYDFTPTVILNPSCGASDRISCTIWDRCEIKKAEMSVLDISSSIIEKVEAMPETCDYIYIGVTFSLLLSLIPAFCRLCEATMDTTNSTEINFFDMPVLLMEKTSMSWSLILLVSFGKSPWDRGIMVSSLLMRVTLTFLFFFLLAVAERTFKQRFLYAKLFSHLTSSRRSRKSEVPHFRLNKVRNIKTWLSVRSYLKRRGPQRSVDVIVSAAFMLTLLLLAFLSVEWLKDSVHLHSQFNLEALLWSCALGIFLLRFMTLGTKINRKYRSISVLITEQINLYLQIEQKPHKKEELMVSNSVLKLAADLLKELESPFKISGLSANPYLYTTVKVVILSALSGVLSEMLGFKLKLHKIKIK